jgi:hypothetical protein
MSGQAHRHLVAGRSQPDVTELFSRVAFCVQALREVLVAVELTAEQDGRELRHVPGTGLRGGAVALDEVPRAVGVACRGQDKPAGNVLPVRLDTLPRCIVLIQPARPGLELRREA